MNHSIQLTMRWYITFLNGEALYVKSEVRLRCIVVLIYKWQLFSNSGDKRISTGIFHRNSLQTSYFLYITS